MAGDSKAGLASLCAFCCVLPVVIALTVIGTLIPIYFLVVGILKIDECHNDPRIPIWMIVIASVMLLERLFGVIIDYKDRRFLALNPKLNLGEEGHETEKEWTRRKVSNRPTGLSVLTILVRISVSVTTIIGIFWVFGIYGNHAECSGYVYYPSFIFCLVAAIAGVIGLLTLGCVCCCTACLGVALASSSNENETANA